MSLDIFAGASIGVLALTLLYFALGLFRRDSRPQTLRTLERAGKGAGRAMGLYFKWLLIVIAISAVLILIAVLGVFFRLRR